MSIPHDLAVEILVQLPTKSLKRFRSVCKAWDFMITKDAGFIYQRCMRQVRNWIAAETLFLSVRAYDYPNIRKLKESGSLCIARVYKKQLFPSSNQLSFYQKSYYNDEYDELIDYIALNYFQRFISSDTFPDLRNINDRDCVRALVISCLFIAMKMKDKSFDKKVYMQNRPHLKIGEQTIDLVGNLILKVIGAPANCVNPLFYVSSFLYLAAEARKCYKLHTIKLILQSQKEIKITQFRPSEIAASAVLISVSFDSVAKFEEVMAIFTGGDFRMERRRLEACSCLIKNCSPNNKMPTPKRMRICHVNEGLLRLNAVAECSSSKMTMNEIVKKEHEVEEDIELEWMFDKDDELFTSLFPMDKSFPKENERCTRKMNIINILRK
ncbi:uncharacterized protein LOC126670178 [Mercurialis annua]|uniref:uncharacterized protein LOC126670178 n=1 Tax=Mercurialis annua TaxID=3986 RepID=UPI00215E8728|nr:uncharacterized protein LOC126670178 [Mercurialis annua]